MASNMIVDTYFCFSAFLGRVWVDNVHLDEDIPPIPSSDSTGLDAGESRSITGNGDDDILQDESTTSPTLASTVSPTESPTFSPTWAPTLDITEGELLEIEESQMGSIPINSVSQSAPGMRFVSICLYWHK